MAEASPVFEAMFTGSSLEANEQLVRIEADPAAVTNLLRHIYGLPITLTVAELPPLLELADMYEVRAAFIKMHGVMGVSSDERALSS